LRLPACFISLKSPAEQKKQLGSKGNHYNHNAHGGVKNGEILIFKAFT